MNKILAAMVMILGLSILPLRAMDLQDLQVQNLSQLAMASYKTYATSSFMNISYSGASTQAVVSIDGTNLIVTAPLLGTALTTLPEATYTTLGTMCDALNLVTGVKCKLTGGFRSDSIYHLKAVAAAAATDAAASGGYDMLIASGTDAASQVNSTTSDEMRIGMNPYPNKGVSLEYCVGTGAGIGQFNVYGMLKRFWNANDGVTRNDSTLVSSQVTADATAKTVGNIYGGVWMDFAPNQHVVVRLMGAPTVQIAGDQLQCFWNEK